MQGGSKSTNQNSVDKLFQYEKKSLSIEELAENDMQTKLTAFVLKEKKLYKCWNS